MKGCEHIVGYEAGWHMGEGGFVYFGETTHLSELGPNADTIFKYCPMCGVRLTQECGIPSSSTLVKLLNDRLNSVAEGE